MARFISLYSGSSGNCSAVIDNGRYLLIDMGQSCKKTVTALQQCGLRPEDCSGILITHEHSDHVKGLTVFLKKYRIPVYGREVTLDDLQFNGIFPAGCCMNKLSLHAPNDVAGFSVDMFKTSHDVPCVGFRIHTADGHVLVIATDTGVLTPDVHAGFAGCDVAVIESNYDLHMLRYGPYSPALKRRIESTNGHLSNDECSAKIMELIQDGCRKFAMCHLSKENNTPQTAGDTLVNMLLSADILPRGEEGQIREDDDTLRLRVTEDLHEVEVHILKREEVSTPIDF